MKREIQLFFSITLCAPLYYILIGDFKSAVITGVAVLIAILTWKYQDKIRENEKVMKVLKKLL
jgi:hypothetical protein